MAMVRTKADVLALDRMIRDERYKVVRKAA